MYLKKDVGGRKQPKTKVSSLYKKENSTESVVSKILTNKQKNLNTLLIKDKSIVNDCENAFVTESHIKYT